MCANKTQLARDTRQFRVKQYEEKNYFIATVRFFLIHINKRKLSQKALALVMLALSSSLFESARN